MTDAPLLTLTERALGRLRAMAEGNGLAPEAFKVIESTEDVYTVEGLIRLSPDIDVQARQYAGPIKSKGRQTLPSFAAMQEEVNLRTKEFKQSKDWLPDAIKELEKTTGHGWGHDGGKITVADKNVTLAASEKCPTCLGNGRLTCPQCQGQTFVICIHCQGRKQENCYNCSGTGLDPVYPQNPCPICHGTRFMPCRYCKATGRLVCPTCQGQGGTPCSTCQGTGVLTQEVDLSANAAIHFIVKTASHLPSGLLRGLDRLGMANLVNGHGDIELIVPDENAPDAPESTIILRAKVPYADIKLQLHGKPVIASAFGKRGLLSGVPPFLDESLRPLFEHLASAAAGKAPLEKALGARLLREALTLELGGKGQLNELRRLYPVGLSSKTAQEILNHLKLALRRITLRARLTVAALCLVISAGLFAGFFLTPLHATLGHSVPPRLALLIDALLPAAALGLSGFSLAHATRWVLQRRFPKADVKFSQSIGKIGYGALAGILLAYMLVYMLAKHLGAL